jgi:hypothetical protein
MRPSATSAPSCGKPGPSATASPQPRKKPSATSSNAEIKAGLDSFGKALDKAIDSGTDAVFRRFDRIEKLLLGEDDRSVRAGKPSIPQMIETIAAVEGNVPAALRKRQIG